jgi:diaminopimelate decarboxylase
MLCHIALELVSLPPSDADVVTDDVVGPVCELSDFFGKKIKNCQLLPRFAQTFSM